MDRLKEFWKNLMGWVSQMTASQVMLLLGIIAGATVGLVLLLGWMTDITYSRLYSHLEESEAGEVITYLQENKVPYELSDGGRTISVPSDQVYETRISLASQGLPRHASMGYSIFDKNNLGMTDFLQNLNFKRALEGELTRTIMQLSEVQAARVHIVMPKDRLFKDDQKDPTASVLLKLRGTLTKHQIQGISHLVSSSVEGLTPDNIAIVDYDGNLLSSGRENDVIAGLSASQLDVRKQVETYLEHKAQSMLDNVLGDGQSVIRVTADLSFQQQERTSETFDPNAPSIRSEERTSNNLTTVDKAEETNESQKEENNETTITNYELNKTVEHIIGEVGTIERLSVAVLVDGIYAPVQGGEAGETAYQPRSQEELDRLSSIVKNAVGFDSQRNDQIELVNLSFDQRDLEQDRQALDAFYTRDLYVDIARKVIYFVAALLLFLYLKKKAGRLLAALGRLMPAPRPGPRIAEQRPETIDEESEPVHPLMTEKRKPRLVDEMQKAAKGQPEEIARVIKTMMVD